MGQNKKIGIFPGSFDPFTNGHLDLIERSLIFLDKLIVAIGVNTKKQSIFSVEERLRMIKTECKRFPQVSVESYEGLSVDFAKLKNAQVIIRGLRAEVDFSYEMSMALMNQHLFSDIQTIFVPTRKEFMHISATLVREIANVGGSVKDLVPLSVYKKLAEKFTVRN